MILTVIKFFNLIHGEHSTITNKQMNDYTKPEYKNLYKEILKDYQFRFPKFNPIPYPFPRKINDFINNQNQKTN